MFTLGIETSCDETSCAVLEGLDKLRSNVISSSLFRHKPFGGIVPEIASRHSLEQIDTVFNEALEQAKVKAGDLDLVAVTYGPGLIGSLLVGVCFAKTLSYRLGIPLVGVNHLEAHLVAPFVSIPDANGKIKRAKVPAHFIGLLVSGGHTMISYHEKQRVKILGETVDDAVGEAYDKTAKILGLGFPGGPVMDKLSYEGNPKAVLFTKPKQDRPYDFSFSGIKTAVLYHVQKQQLDKQSETHRQTIIRDVAASFQSSVISWLVDKTLRAAELKKVKDIVVGGGVSANSLLRKRLTEEAAAIGIKVWFPPFSLTLDNAGMIARRGVELYQKGKRSGLKLSANPNLKVV